MCILLCFFSFVCVISLRRCLWVLRRCLWVYFAWLWMLNVLYDCLQLHVICIYVYFLCVFSLLRSLWFQAVDLRWYALVRARITLFKCGETHVIIKGLNIVMYCCFLTCLCGWEVAIAWWFLFCFVRQADSIAAYCSVWRLLQLDLFSAWRLRM